MKRPGARSVTASALVSAFEVADAVGGGRRGWPHGGVLLAGQDAGRKRLHHGAVRPAPAPRPSQNCDREKVVPGARFIPAPC